MTSHSGSAYVTIFDRGWKKQLWSITQNPIEFYLDTYNQLITIQCVHWKQQHCNIVIEHVVICILEKGIQETTTCCSISNKSSIRSDRPWAAIYPPPPRGILQGYIFLKAYTKCYKMSHVSTLTVGAFRIFGVKHEEIMQKSLKIGNNF